MKINKIIQRMYNVTLLFLFLTYFIIKKKLPYKLRKFYEKMLQNNYKNLGIELCGEEPWQSVNEEEMLI